MSRASIAGNSVMKAVGDLCGFYGVPAIRMQSRMFRVPGVGGKERPFFVGEWTDHMGQKHFGGMADWLLQPKITVKATATVKGQQVFIPLSFVSPLWVECKAGDGKQTPDQVAFQGWVEHIGASYLLVNDSCEQLLSWFKERGVRRD
jgi:hypothetical protein